MTRTMPEAHDSGLPLDQRGWAFACQDARQLPAQCPVFIVEVFPAEGVGHADDLVMRRRAASGSRS